MGENKKSSKIAFPSRGKTKNHRKSLFPTLGRLKISKNRFPNFGKTGKQRKSPFPTLGRLKNSENWLSQTWEEQKMPLAAFPNPRKDEKTPKVRRNNFRGTGLFCYALLFYNRSRMLICYSLPFQHKHQ